MALEISCSDPAPVVCVLSLALLGECMWRAELGPCIVSRGPWGEDFSTGSLTEDISDGSGRGGFPKEDKGLLQEGGEGVQGKRKQH